MSEFSALQSLAIDLAEKHLGMTEEGGKNRGPLIDRWLAELGLPPGLPWCLAFVQAMYAEAARRLGMKNPIPRTARVSRFWRTADPKYKAQKPRLGAIFCHVTDATLPNSPGHCGIVTSIGWESIISIEGNTDIAGSREGNKVMHRQRPTSYVNLGYVDVSKMDV